MNIIGIAAILNLILTFVLLGLVALRMRTPGKHGSEEVESRLRSELRSIGAELRQDLSGQRIELQGVMAEGQRQLENRVRIASETQSAQIELERAGRTTADETQAKSIERDREIRQKFQEDLRTTVDASLREINDKVALQTQANHDAQTQLRRAIEERFDGLRVANDKQLEQVREAVERLQTSNTVSLDANAQRITSLTQSNAEKQLELQGVLREQLDLLRQGNEAKLEKMRETVDEKLQGTLEKRLGESFALVSERLEQVQKGLGEMTSLAADVGGLKRVLTNVKSRGSWGEVQLSRQLEDMLSPEQFERNVVVKPETRESVEFAVRLPGRDDDLVVYLPIDSKLPQEDYERLLSAQESGEKDHIDSAIKDLERAIIIQAKSISQKYISPPNTTDFAIMYLPTEGLFAEVVRQPGLASRLQNDHRVLITGPTTLMSLLNSLQMGFRTLAIERRSSEVWQVLSAAKSEFQKYGAVWAKLEKQLGTVQNTVADAGRRTRAVERQLRAVETLGDEKIEAKQAEVIDLEDLIDVPPSEVSDTEDELA